MAQINRANTECSIVIMGTKRNLVEVFEAPCQLQDFDWRVHIHGRVATLLPPEVVVFALSTKASPYRRGNTLQSFNVEQNATMGSPGQTQQSFPCWPVMRPIVHVFDRWEVREGESWQDDVLPVAEQSFECVRGETGVVLNQEEVGIATVYSGLDSPVTHLGMAPQPASGDSGCSLFLRDETWNEYRNSRWPVGSAHRQSVISR